MAEVTIAAARNGVEIGKATTARDGTWEIPLPGPGRYTITLDVAGGGFAAYDPAHLVRQQHFVTHGLPVYFSLC